MKIVILKELTISNWRSLNLNVRFNGTSNEIKGANGVGKSSLQNAWNWLLHGYCEPNQPKNHELFDNRTEITNETPIASVKAVIAIGDLEYTLEKTAQAKFTRKRGSGEYVKDTSDLYKYLIDNIEYSLTNWNEWIENNITDYQMVQECADGRFFATLCEEDKTQARKMLEVLSGEVKEEDFKGDYSLLKEDFAKGYSVEQIEEKTKNTIKPKKERLDNIPAIIEDKEKALSEYNQINFDGILNEINEKKKLIEDIDAQMLGKAEALQPILGKRDAIYEIISKKRYELQNKEIEYNEKYNKGKKEIEKKIKSIEDDNRFISQSNLSKKQLHEQKKKELETLEKTLENLNYDINKLRNEKDSWKAKEYKDDVCSVCGRVLPDDMLEKAKETFAKTKEEKLALIIKNGKALKVQIEETEKHINELKKVVDLGYKEDALKSKETHQDELNNYINSFVPYNETDEYKALKKAIEDTEKTLPEIPQNENEELTKSKSKIMLELDALNRKYGLKDKQEKLKKEIADLKKETRDLSNQIASLEGVLSKCFEYVEERAKIVAWKVNQHLEDCSIQMFERQKNGTLKPSCTIIDKKGVKYSTTNNASRIKANISLQELFMKLNNVSMPIWVDESSIFSKSNLPTKDGQIIYMFASEDKELVIN